MKWFVGGLMCLVFFGCSEDAKHTDGADMMNEEMTPDQTQDQTIQKDMSMPTTPTLSLSTLTVEAPVKDVVAINGQVYLLSDNQTWRLNGAALEATSLPAPVVGEDQLPQSSLVQGDNIIAQAWLSMPTTRYGHGVLGDAVEAGALSVLLSTGERRQVVLDEMSVFEDLTPRLVDIDNDGQDEVLVVRAYLNAGAAPVLYRVKDNQLEFIWEPEAIGTPNRWLNPVGVADLDGDGQQELAYVVRPHLDGTLTIWRWREQQMQPVTTLSGFSNHGIGSTSLGLSVITSPRADGSRWMIVPASGRAALRLVALEGDTLKILATASLDAAMGSDLISLGEDRWLFADAQGKVHVVEIHL